MSFMQPEIIHDLFLVIETRDGNTVIPADVALSVQSLWYMTMADHAGKQDAGALYSAEDEHEGWDDLTAALRDYVEGYAPIQAVTAKYAYGARLSAPGYMDCTEWSLHATEAEAREALADMYGDEEGED